MKNTLHTTRKKLRAGTALQALALIGAGASITAVASAPAAAQDYTTGILVGTVQDSAGVPATGGDVTVTSNQQGFTRTTTFGSDGRFRVPQLPTGTYTVTITTASGAVITDQAVRIAANTANTYVFTTAVAGDEILVTGTAERTNDFAATRTGLTLNVDELYDTVPVNRDQTSLILLSPGTTAGDTGFGNLASIGGATVAENSYYVNGLNTTDFRTFLGSSIVPFEFYDSFDVNTGGYQAEFGRALGGFVSATTKRGTNEFEGGVVVSWEPDALRSDSPNTYAAFNETDQVEEVDATFYLGGPIIRDRLFFYGFYNPRHSTAENSSITGGFRTFGNTSPEYYGGKFDAIITDGHRLELTYFSDERTSYTDYYRFDAATEEVLGFYGSRSVTSGGQNFIATYTGAFTDWFTISASYGENRNKGIQAVSPNLSSYVSNITGTSLQASGVASAYTSDDDERTVYRIDADVYASFLGEHHFRFGYDREDLRALEDTAYTGPGGYRYLLYPAYFFRYYYRNVGEFETQQSAFYVQDSWALMNGRLNLNLGVRFDKFENSNQFGEVYYETDYKVGPRLGATFDLFGDQRTKLSAFWGRYYLPIATNTNLRLAGAETYYRQVMRYPAGVNPSLAALDPYGLPAGIDPNQVLSGTVFASSNPCPAGSPNAGELCYSVYADGSIKPTDVLVASSLQPSYQDEWILGISHSFDAFDVSLTYTNRRLGDTLEDVAVDAAVLAYFAENGIAGCDSEWTGFHQYVLANPGSDITVRLDGDCSIPGQCDVVTLAAEDLGYPKAQRNYDSVQFTLDKPWDGVWSLGGSYTWTHLRGNFEGGVKSDNNQSDTGLTQDFDQPGFLVGAYGPLANEREHSFKLYGGFQATEWLRLGFNFAAESPRKFSCIGNWDSDGDPLDEDDYPFGDFEYGYGAASFFCSNVNATGNPLFEYDADGDGVVAPGENDGVTTVPALIPRGTAFESDWRTSLDLKAAITIPGLDGVQLGIDVFNVLNSKAEVDFQEFGDFNNAGANPRYGQVTGYQTPRFVRFSLKMGFGGDVR